MKIQAAVLRESSRPLVIEELDLDEVRSDEVRVKIAFCGVCHTDVACRDAVIPLKLPLVLGHEGAGIVEEVGAGVTRVRPGDHVLLSFASCGFCHSCRTAHPAYCEHFNPMNFGGARSDGTTTLSGPKGAVNSLFFGQSAFATHAIVPQSSLIRVDPDLPLDVLAPLGCGVQTGAGAVLNSLQARPGDSIAVFGVGAVGMSAIMAARASGCSKIVAIDRVRQRLELALELGATHVVDAKETSDLIDEVRSISNSGVTHVVDSTGVGDVVAQALQCLSLRGTCALVGMYPPGHRLPIDTRFIVLNGINVKGIVEGDSQPSHFIPRLIELYQAGNFPLDRLITPFGFADVNAAMDASAACAVLKPVLWFN
ncbi:NAD(P)-dependent alcohol dehydrogenase [Bradyrhizobium lablabi]|uniref:NAD(P)-dependent alcohol dehydrogenase n=1 Tax=Bradyrhizobium lablabi TaxID=722472 RepID=UPI000909F774|nr:NAD(P)-dependent alcohol dehydrogenase [Bradyrhizobium lablabi]SHM10659.1 aryl-alcohol dehydrogenase [Bradyrhizobium lablabi]